MASGRIQRIQDSVHGLMEFRGMEASSIDLLRTPELQRLRRIRQLGLAHLVFPGAEHSRLVHCLGASYLAILFGRQLQDAASDLLVPDLCPAEDSIRDLAIAALCHDLGHGPLSHAWEREIIGEHYSQRAWQQSLGLAENDALLPDKPKWHELVGHALLSWPDGQLHRLLEQQEEGLSTRIRQLLGGKYFLTYLPRLLASDVDVDRADFIRRDTHQTGVAYGRYDLEWLISTCMIGEEDYSGGSQLIVGFDGRKAVRVVEQFLIARRALYDTVYQHKAVRCAEGMVALFLRRLKHVIQDGIRVDVSGFVAPLLKTVRGDAVGPEDLLALDDFSLTVLIDSVANSPSMDPTARDLANRIVARDLFKAVPLPSDTVNAYLRQPHSYARLYDAIKPYCPGESEYYLVVDTVKFCMLSDDPKNRVYIIGQDHKAKSANDHELLQSYRGVSKDAVRLFTPREAIPAVTRLIQENV